MVSDVYSVTSVTGIRNLDSNVQQPWRGQTTLILALLAVALGLGNVLRLPYIIGEQGGGAFLIVYCVVLAIVVGPLLVAELTLGSLGRASPMGSIQWVASLAGRDTRWRWIGALQAVLAFLVATLLLVPIVVGIEAAYSIYQGEWGAASADEIVTALSTIETADHLRILALVVGVVVVTALPGPQVILTVVGWILMPTILGMLYVSLGFALEVGDLSAANEWLFKYRPEQLSQEGMLTAALAALSTLGAGVGIGLVFGSRSPQGLPLIRSVVAVGILDTSVMLVTAIVIVAVTAAVDVEMTQGLVLLVVSLPYAFVNLPIGELYGILIMSSILLSSLAALIALIEPMVAILSRELEIPRVLAMGAIALFLFGSAALAITGNELRQTIDGWLVPILIPFILGITGVFTAWRVPRPILRGEKYREPFPLFYGWFFLLRWLAPVLCLMLGILTLLRVIN